MELRPKVLLQTLADVGPVCCQIQRFLVLDHCAVTSLLARHATLAFALGSGRHGADRASPCEIVYFHASLPRLNWPARIPGTQAQNAPALPHKAQQTLFDKISSDTKWQ